MWIIGQLAQGAFSDGLQESGVTVEELQGNPIGVGYCGINGTDIGSDSFHSRLQAGDIKGEPCWLALESACGYFANGSEKVLNAFPVPCHAWYDRYAQVGSQAAMVDFNTVSLGLVHEVQAHDRATGNLQYLHGQVQIALKAGRINDNDHHIRLPKQDEVPCDPFVH